MSRVSSYSYIGRENFDELLYFPVSKHDVYVDNLLVSGKKAIVNDESGNVIEIVGPSYQIVLHRDVVEQFNDALDEISRNGGLHFLHRATAIERAGARMFREYNTGYSFIVSGTAISPVLCIKNSYDKSLACSSDVYCTVIGDDGKEINLFSDIQLSFKHSTNMKLTTLVRNLTEAIERIKNHEKIWKEWDKEGYSTIDLLVDTQTLKDLLGPALSERFQEKIMATKLIRVFTKWQLFKCFCDTLFNEMNDKTRRSSIISNARKIFYVKSTN